MKKMLRIIMVLMIVSQCNLLVVFAAVGQPKITKVKQTGQKEVTVTWSKVSGATGYTVEYKCAGGKWIEKKTSKRELVLVKLKQNKTYRIRVRAYKDSKKKSISAVYKFGKYSLEKKIRVSKLAKTNSFNPSLTGFFVIESKYNANGTVALDINDNNMGNRGNLETYPRHSGPNQVFLVSSVGNGYYTLSPVHSRKYIHRADGSSVNIYQWDGSTNWNAHWQIISAGSGYYYLRNRASGKYMTRDLDRSRSSNNVYEASRPIGYSLKTQKWKFISVGRPGYSLNTSMENGPASTYSREDTFTTRYTLNSNYPITRWELNVYTSNGVHKLSGVNTPNYPVSSETWSIPMKLLSAGNYYIHLIAWNAWGDGVCSPKYYFSVRDNIVKTEKSSSGFLKYALTETQLLRIARLCQQEQGTVAGAKAEASLMANQLETSKWRQNRYGTGANGLYNWVRNGGWFSRASYWMDNGTVSSSVLAGVRDVLVNGNRTLPLYVDEHDCLSDITSISTGKVKNRGNYVSGKTIVKNRYGSKWTFWCFPDKTSDPFGYTDSAYKAAQAQGMQ